MKSFGKIVTAVAIGLLAATSAVTAQTNAPFDAKKFFEELQNRGAQMPPSFDPQKFFEEIQQKGGQLPPMVKVK